jgi:hypothetical protein
LHNRQGQEDDGEPADQGEETAAMKHVNLSLEKSPIDSASPLPACLAPFFPMQPFFSPRLTSQEASERRCTQAAPGNFRSRHTLRQALSAGSPQSLPIRPPTTPIGPIREGVRNLPGFR